MDWNRESLSSLYRHGMIELNYVIKLNINLCLVLEAHQFYDFYVHSVKAEAYNPSG